MSSSVRVIPYCARGLTLVELMVGMAVGLFVSLIAISVFISTRSLNSVTSAATRMGENARLAMDVLHEDLRSAGFRGCFDRTANPGDPAASQVNSILNVAADAGFLDAGIGVAGHTGDGTGFTPTRNKKAWDDDVLPAKPEPDSDILSLRVPADNTSFGLTQPTSASAPNPQIGASTPGNTFVSGDIALVDSCRQLGTIFQVTSANPGSSGDLAHTTDNSFLPGNALANLPVAYGSDASVYRMQTRHYYVAESVVRPGTNSLWRMTVPPSPPGTPAIEVAASIDRLKVMWGIDSSGDRTVNRYVSADNIPLESGLPAWRMVVAVRLQLLTATVDDGITQGIQTIEFDGSASDAPDRRLRTVVTEVVTLRNHVP